MSSQSDVPGPVADPASVDASLASAARLPDQNPDVVLRLAKDGRVLYANPSAQSMFVGELAVGSLAPAALLPAVSQALASGAVQKTELQHGDRWLSVRTTADGQEANVYARDITDRKQAEQALRESERHASRLNAVLSGIARIFREALTCATEEELGKVCLSVAEEITQSKFGYIDEINRETGKLDAIAISDPGWDVCRMHDKSGHGQKVLSGFSVAGLHGRVLREGAALMTNAPSSHPGGMGTPEGHPPLTAFLGVPLKHAGETIGLVGLGNREGGYGQDELSAVEALAPAIVQAFISKRAEERLRHSHQEYRHLVESSGSVILRVDKEMRITFVNQYGLRFFGYSPEELIGKRALGTIVPSRETTGRDTAAMAEDIIGNPEGYRQNVHQNLRKDGSLVWMSWTNTPIYDDAGGLVEILSVGNDLSALKQAEAAFRKAVDELHESETRYRTLVELAPDAVLVHQDRKIVFANAEALRLYGASKPDELLGRDIVELVAPEDRATSAERVEHAERGHRTAAREFPLLTLDGRCVPAEARGSGIHFQGRLAVQVVIRDVTERKRAEDALRRQGEQLMEARRAAENEKRSLEALMEALPVGVALTDAHGGSLRSNKTFDEVWRGPKPVPRSVADYAAYRAWWADTGRELAPEEWASAQAIKTGEPVLRQVVEIQRFDGTRATVLNSGAPIRDAAGEIVGSAVAIQDIGALRQAEEAAKRTHRAFVDAVESLQDGFVALDREWRFTYVNRAAARNVGFEPNDLIGRSMWEVFPSLVGTASETAFRRAMAEQVAATIEVKGTLSDRWYRQGIYPAADGVTVIWTDITERRRIEESLRESEARLRAAIRNAEFVPAQVDRELRYQWIYNPHPDFNAASVIGKRDDELEHSEGTRRLVAAKQRVIESGVGVREEIAFERSDGFRVYDFALEPMLDADNTVIGVTSAAFDVTARKRAQEALRQSEDLVRRQLVELRSIYDSAHVGLCVFDRELRYVRINQRLAEINGVPAADHVGKTVGEVVPALAATARDLAERIFATGDGITDIEFSGTTTAQPTRQRTWLEQWLPLKDPEGAVTGINVVVEDITERKRLEEALHEGQERLRLALSAGAMAAWDWNLVTGEVVWNDEHFRMLGYEPGTVRPSFEAWAERVHPADRAATEALVMASVEKGGEYRGEFRALRPDGSVRWIEARGRMDLSPDGKPSRQYGVMMDITERKRAEEALRESEERLRCMATAARIGFFEWRTSKGTTYWSPEHYELFGYEPGSPISWQRWQQSLHPEDRERVMEHAARLLEQARSEGHVRGHKDEYRITRADGSVVWLEGDLSADANNDEVILRGSVRDITERKRAEEALRESEARYKELVRLAPAGIYEVNFRTGRFTSVNDAMIEILGYSREELLSMSPLDVLETESRARFQDRLARWLSGEKPEAEVEFRVRTKDGRTIDALLAVSFTVDEAGRPLGATVVAHDITDRKRAEEALQGSREALREANSRLTEADRRKNEFLAVLSHELRNPLAPITNSLYILDRAAPGGEQANRATRVISRQVAHLSSLVDDLLDVTRITRNKIQLQKERIELNEVVRRAVEDNRSLFERADVSLDLAPAPRPIPVIADRTRVVQIVGNLLQNAAKFTLKGGCTHVSVTTEANAAVIRVTDDGVGMAAEILAGLFQPFMQADHTLDRSKGGLGLGLALVKGLVELHNGSVSAHSAGPGKGTEFVVRLPMDTGVALESEATRLDRPKARRRILIIEDNVDAADSLREALELSDHEVATAHDGPEGLAKARMFQPEVVLCDIGLPGMDGFEVARAFRAEEALRGTFLVALSGYALPEDLQRAADAGFERHLAKPPSLEKLEELLASLPASGSAGPDAGEL